jgi:hypothetical protein
MFVLTSYTFHQNLDILISITALLNSTNLFGFLNEENGQGSSVIIATGYGLDGPGIESR